jgi:PAS domain S-box-containing protein
VTNKNNAEDECFTRMVAALPEAACLFERVSGRDEQVQWRYVANNLAMQAMFGVDDLSGQTLEDRFPDFAEHWHANLEDALTSGRPEVLPPYEGSYSGIYEVTLSALAHPSRKLVLALVRDATVTTRQREEAAETDSRYKALFNAIDAGFCLIEMVFDDGGRPQDYRFVETNAAFEAQSGVVNAVGSTMRELEPHIEDRWFEIYGEVARSGAPARFELGSDALGRTYDVFAFAAGAPGTNLVGILFEDVTDARTSERARQRSERRLSSLINVSSDVVYRMSPDWNELTELHGKGLLTPGADPQNWLADLVPGEDHAALAAAVERSLATLEPFDEEIRVRRADGSIGWFHSRAVPVLEGDGTIIEWFGMATDITQRRRAEEDLKHGAEMLRIAADIGEIGIWDWDMDADRIVWSESHYRMLGYAETEIEAGYSTWQQRVHPDDLENVEAALEAARDGKRPYICEYRIIRPDGAVRWLSARGKFFYHADGKPSRMLGAMVDTTAQRRQTEWQRLLVAELQHRVRNLVSMIRSLVRQSAESHDTVEDYVDHLTGRLAAMGRTQTALTRSPGAQVDLASLVREEMVACAAREKAYRIEGPDVALSPHHAEVMTLVIHELAANSLKYGALGGEGYVKIGWTLIEKDSTLLQLRWQETGLGVADPPDRQGFGRRLIEERIAYELGGSGLLNVHDTGVLAEIEFPLEDRGSVLETGTPRVEQQRDGERS